MKYIIVFLFVIPVLMANKCQSGKSEKKSAAAPAIKKVVVDKAFSATKIINPVSIKEATLTDTILNLKFSFKGCENDEFDLIFTGNYLKTYPPKATLYLFNKSIDNKCEKMTDKEISFIISPVKYPSAKTVIILLPEYDQNIVYNY